MTPTGLRRRRLNASDSLNTKQDMSVLYIHKISLSGTVRLNHEVT